LERVVSWVGDSNVICWCFELGEGRWWWVGVVVVEERWLSRGWVLAVHALGGLAQIGQWVVVSGKSGRRFRVGLCDYVWWRVGWREAGARE